MTESLVDVSPSTLRRLNETSTADRSAFCKALGATAASVVMKQSMVAMRGWIIPAHLAIPARCTACPSSSLRRTQDLGNVSVVRMACATEEALAVERLSLSL